MSLSCESERKSSSCGKGDKVEQCQPSHISSRMFSTILNPILFPVIVNIRWLVHRQKWLAVKMDLNSWLLFRVEAERNLIETRRYSNDACLALFPQEIVRASVQCLNFPRNKIVRSFHLSTLPNPPSYAILSTERFIN